jgi:hypothetical protein
MKMNKYIQTMTLVVVAIFALIFTACEEGAPLMANNIGDNNSFIESSSSIDDQAVSQEQQLELGSSSSQTSTPVQVDPSDTTPVIPPKPPASSSSAVVPPSSANTTVVPDTSNGDYFRIYWDGIYTTSDFPWGLDGDLGVWTSTAGAVRVDEVTTFAAEGTSSHRFRISGVGSAFYYVQPDAALDLSDFSGGALCFQIRTPNTTGRIEMKSESATGQAKSHTLHLSNYLNAQGLNDWQQVCLPIELYENAGVDLSSITVVLGLQGVSSGTTLYMDDVYIVR